MQSESLKSLAMKRLRTLPTFGRRASMASELVIFGSRSAKVERPDSDIDILCVGVASRSVKFDGVDLIAISSDEICEPRWLHSELASHIAKYGVWVRGEARWVKDARIGSGAVSAKRERIAAFVRALPARWNALHEHFRVKYAIKLRRETQRYLLLKHGIAVPPTRMLDEAWAGFAIPPQEVELHLARAIDRRADRFRHDLLIRINTALETGDCGTARWRSESKACGT